jgi:PBP1b-binding outer membrane lipoprotein LpoB
MKRIALLAIIPALLVGCATSKSTSYTVTPDVSVTVKDTKKKAKSPYVQTQTGTMPVAGAAGGTSR